jgi:hypothetical protein
MNDNFWNSDLMNPSAMANAFMNTSFTGNMMPMPNQFGNFDIPQAPDVAQQTVNLGNYMPMIGPQFPNFGDVDYTSSYESTVPDVSVVPPAAANATTAGNGSTGNAAMMGHVMATGQYGFTPMSEPEVPSRNVTHNLQGQGIDNSNIQMPGNASNNMPAVQQRGPNATQAADGRTYSQALDMTFHGPEEFDFLNTMTKGVEELRRQSEAAQNNQAPRDDSVVADEEVDTGNAAGSPLVDPDLANFEFDNATEGQQFDSSASPYGNFSGVDDVDVSGWHNIFGNGSNQQQN